MSSSSSTTQRVLQSHISFTAAITAAAAESELCLHKTCSKNETFMVYFRFRCLSSKHILMETVSVSIT